jgi:hypothetical protein
MFSTITAKYPTTCKRCGGDIRPGDRVRYGGPRVGCYHLAADCPAAEQQDGHHQPTTAPARPRPSLTCPTCKTPNALTPFEARRGYQCRHCTAAEEGPGAPAVFFAPPE